MEAIFNFDPDLAIPIPTNTDSGIEPYVQKAECTFSDDVDIFAVMRDPVARRELDKPQNNLFGAYLLAKQEIDRQISLELNADKTNAEANDGNLGTSGTTAEESCVEGYFDEQGICQQYVPNNTAGWLINQNVADANKAELDLIVNGNTMGGLLADMRHRILARMQNFAYSQVDVLFSRDWSTELYQDSDPGDPSEQNQTDPDNENCGMPSTTECTCTINDPQAQTIGQNLVSEMQQVARENPQLFVNGDPGSGQLIPGANVEFINKLCLALQLDNDGCRAYVPRADDVILLPLGGGNTAAIDIITAPERGNRLRSTPATKYVCPHSAY
ncbi:MAG: hypothetical protein R3284_10855 [Rubricoccaceae bacterium]|nr:hypothetical protein [Rubricoccaceae bacterium]